MSVVASALPPDLLDRIVSRLWNQQMDTHDMRSDIRAKFGCCAISEGQVANALARVRNRAHAARTAQVAV